MRIRRNGLAGDPGFTVVELVIAAAVLFVVAVGAMGGIAYAAQSAAISARRVEALGIANQQIEMARNLPFDLVSTIVPANGLPAGKLPGTQTIGQYTVTTSVAYGTYNASTASRYKTISVVVSWTKPIPGSVTVKSFVAGASGTQDYNFGIVKVLVQDTSTPPNLLPGCTVNLLDLNNSSYSVATNATGCAEFDYVPSGNVTANSTLPGYLVDALGSSACVANQVTTYTVIAHPVRTGTIKCLCASGTVVPGITVSLDSGPSSPGTIVTGSDGNAIFAGTLIDGTYTVHTADSTYFKAITSNSNKLTLSGANGSMNVTLVAKPATVVATLAAKGTVYIWNPNGSTAATATATTNSSPYTATISLTNGDANPRLYYFTKSNTFATTNPLNVTAAQSYALTVN